KGRGAKRAVEGFWSPNPAKSRFRKPNLNLNTSEWPVVQRLHDRDNDQKLNKRETSAHATASLMFADDNGSEHYIVTRQP
ncbi:MAG: hypothetical protein ABFD96_00915, partial [Armatimonadia bacterium]